MRSVSEKRLWSRLSAELLAVENEMLILRMKNNEENVQSYGNSFERFF